MSNLWRLMKEKQVKPIKRFGQNYLIDRNIINKIISRFSPKPNDIVLEIGPGQGALTGRLNELLSSYYAVEIDKRVIDTLSASYPNLKLINRDFLEFDLAVLNLKEGEKLRVIGNIPYNITSPILFKLIENRNIIADAMLMTQYEVAKRLTARPATKEYGILSVLLDLFTETELCFKISPNVFFPKPKVWSAVVHIKFRQELSAEIDPALFIKIVKASFGNRRKTLKNSLSNSIFAGQNLSAANNLLTRRAEELSTEDFIYLTRIIGGQLNG